MEYEAPTIRHLGDVAEITESFLELAIPNSSVPIDNDHQVPVG
jgi:hypothetical protein